MTEKGPELLSSSDGALYQCVTARAGGGPRYDSAASPARSSGDRMRGQGGQHQAPPMSDPKDLIPYYPAVDAQEWLRTNPAKGDPGYTERHRWAPRHRAAQIDNGFISTQSLGLWTRWRVLVGAAAVR